MDIDKEYIYQDNMEKDMSIYEVQSVRAGHLALEHQNERVLYR